MIEAANDNDFRTGKLEGKLEGRIEGKLEALLAQLEAKFGRLTPNVVQHLAGLDADHLQRLIVGVLKANSLEDLNLQD